MWLQLWKKLLKRKPIAAVILGLVLFSAIITIFRLSNSSPSRDDHYVSSRSFSGRSTSPVELSWPLPLTSERLKRADMKSKKIFVDLDQMIKLKKIYPLLDTNSDGSVSVDELRNWIISKVKEHLQGAVRENIFLFTSIDTDPRNGQVSWKEYHSWFLKKSGNNDTSQSVNHDESHPELERSIKEKIAWDQAAWSEAAKTDPDFLNLDEFLSFRHPESSHSSLLSKADDLIGEYDKDADEILNWEEYSSIPSDNMIVRYTDTTRKDEFEHFMDKNKDGKLDKREILSYMDPRNPRHAHLEAVSLIQLSDKNKDKQLSLDEILASADLFLASKVIDTETNFHDEF